MNLLDAPADAPMGRIAGFASDGQQVPIAATSLLDAPPPWYKSSVGLVATETPRDLTFCAYAVFSSAPLVVEDALQDRRCVRNPLVTCGLGIRSCAGMPLIAGKAAPGTLSIINRVQSRSDPTDLAMLATLSDIVVDQILLAPRMSEPPAPRGA